MVQRSATGPYPTFLVTNQARLRKSDQSRPAVSVQSAAGRPGSFLLLDQLAFDHDLYSVADDELAIQHHVEGQAKVPPVNLGGGAVGNAVAHHSWVVELPIPGHVQRDLAGRALDRQVARQRV